MHEEKEAIPLSINKKRIRYFIPIRLSLGIGCLYTIEQMISIALTYPSAMRGIRLGLMVLFCCIASLVFLVLLPGTVFFMYALFSQKPFVVLDKKGLSFFVWPHLFSFSHNLFICWEEIVEIYLVADSPEPLLGILPQHYLLRGQQKPGKLFFLHCSWLMISLDELICLFESYSGQQVHGGSFLHAENPVNAETDS